MPELPLETPQILALYLQIAQYPILAREIRRHMREELYRRGVITSQQLEQEAHDKAVHSQHREGLSNPYGQEDERAWQDRLGQIRDHLTDFYFAYNLPMELFHRIVERLVAQRSAILQPEALPQAARLGFNPELAPVDLLLRQARLYEALPADERAKIGHHLEEIIVVLTKTMISDQLSFVRVAKAWFTAADFNFIHSRRIGNGKIGGKAAGMLLAWKILNTAAPELAAQMTVPRSYFVGADVFYDFTSLNGLEYINQKYKSPDQIRAEYEEVQEAHMRARFPEDVADRLRTILAEVGRTPLIVRSSSLLEDNFGTSFAGKYASYFCPNQGTLRENLRDLTRAISRIYASVYGPDVLIYRRRRGLLDYDERMAILLQEVQGEAYRGYFFPSLAGVAFSTSPIVWNTRLRREEGFMRLVLGLGTRAVERVGEDYPRLIFLSHPLLRPENSPAEMEHYSQHFLDALDLQANAFKSVPIRRVLDLDYPALRWVASLMDAESETLLPLQSLGPQVKPDRLVLTFDNLLRRTDFVALVKRVLSTLAQNYGFPVDVEFAATLAPEAGRPRLTFHLLQCRPQSSLRGEAARPFPAELAAHDKLFQATRMVPQGQVSGVEYILYVDPMVYARLPDSARRVDVARMVGRLNKALEGRPFILMGPGRWGSSNLQLGVPVTYADIYNARALVEISVGPDGMGPDPSYGTHFFQDLVESQIYSLAIHVSPTAEFAPSLRSGQALSAGEGPRADPPAGAREFPASLAWDAGSRSEAPAVSGSAGQAEGSAGMSVEFVNWDFLQGAADRLLTILPEATRSVECLKLIHVPAEREGLRLDILMDGERALAYFAPAQ